MPFNPHFELFVTKVHEPLFRGADVAIDYTIRGKFHGAKFHGEHSIHVAPGMADAVKAGDRYALKNIAPATPSEDRAIVRMFYGSERFDLGGKVEVRYEVDIRFFGLWQKITQTRSVFVRELYGNPGDSNQWVLVLEKAPRAGVCEQ